MDWPKLKNPPLREAIFDLRYPTSSATSIDKIRDFCRQFKTEFPEINEIFVFSLKANIGPGDKKEELQTKRISNGFRLTNKNKSFILQLRSDGFTFSKVSPYVSWEEIRLEVLPILKKFLPFFSGVKITRIALRYINEFTLKLEQQPSSYFKILPSYPEVIGNIVDRFAIQLAIPKKESQLQSQIAFNIEPTSVEKTYKVTFDIDIFKHDLYDEKSMEKMLADFETIRDFKNQIFFNSFTPELLKNFN